MLRVEATEDLEKVSVARGGERDTRISEQQRETRSEGGPQDHHRYNRSHIRPVNPLHHQRHDKLRGLVSLAGEFAPRNNADDRKVDRDVDRRDRDHADDDRARDRPSGIFDLVADVADVVIAQVIVDADLRSRAESEQKSGREVERAGWKIESDFRVEMRRAGQDHSAGREQRSDPETDGDLADVLNLTVEQRDVDQADDYCHGEDVDRHPSDRHRELRRLPDVIQVLREADVARGDLQRPADDELPDEEECHQSPEGSPLETQIQTQREATAQKRYQSSKRYPPETFSQVDV